MVGAQLLQASKDRAALQVVVGPLCFLTVTDRMIMTSRARDSEGGGRRGITTDEPAINKLITVLLNYLSVT